MATNPQQVLNQTIATPQQPTAQQTPLAQASSTLPASQFPSAAVPGLAGQGAPSAPTQTPGLGSSGSGLALGSLGDLPQIQPYTSSLPYLAALEQQPQLTIPNLGDPVLASIQQKLLAQQQSNPLLNGSQQAQPTSRLAQAQSAMSPLELIQSAGQGIWTQEIAKPIQDYIHTWQTNPGQAFLETLGGVAVTAGLVGLEAVTGGAATPFIFAGLAALQAPNLINAYSQEILHPSDANLVQAMVSTGAGVLAVGSPIRAFKGLKTTRNLLESQIQARKDLSAPGDVADLLIRNRASGEGVKGLQTGASLVQLGTLDVNNIDALTQQLSAEKLDPKSSAAAMLRHGEAIAKLQEDIKSAHEIGDSEAAMKAVGELKDYASNEMRDDFLHTAYKYVYLPTSPHVHVPVGPIEGVEAGLQKDLNGRTNAIFGLLRRMHSGIGLQTVSDMAHQDIASIKEAEGYDQAAGTPFDSTNRIMTHLLEMQKAAGIGSDDHELINQALEEPDKWKSLTSGQQAYAQKLRDVSDYMTVGDLRYGTISQPLQGTMHRYFTGVATTFAPGDVVKSIEGELSDLRKGAGVSKEDHASVLESLGRPEEWKKLTPELRAYGEKLRLKVQQAQEKAAKQVYTTSWLDRPVGVRSDLFKAAVNDETGAVKYRTKTRAEIVKDQKEQSDFYERTHDHRQKYNSHKFQLQTWNRSLGQLKRHGNDAGIVALESEVRSWLGKTGVELLHMTQSELNKILNAAPQTEELVTGFESVRRAITNHVFRVQRAAFGEALQVHSNMAVERLKKIFGDTPVSHWGAQMALPAFKDASEFPDVLPETVFHGAKNVEEAAQRLGYFKVHPATGSPDELNYRPALYARDKIANEIASASEKMTSSEMQSGLINALYKVSAGSKRYIMYNPVYHFLNVAGRAMAFLGSDPALAGTAMRGVFDLHKDPAAYHDLLEEASMSGLVPATQWNVAEHLRVSQREEDGQHSFFGAVRNFGRALDNVHRDTAERGLWSAVDQLQLAGYVYSKQRFLNKGIAEFEARRLASTYANNLGGMVNPLYMSRLWRHMKGLVFFAPSYWSTFLHSIQSVIPGNARLSQAMANIAGGKMVGLTTTPLRTMDYRHRIELARAQRDWMITYLATTAVTMDMFNVMFSGHHLWDNEQGHQWNIDVTNASGTQTSPSGEVKRAYISGIPFFRQGVDVGNAIGLGHDWGFGHVFGDKTWQQQDILHKTELAAGALLDGVRRTGSTKLGSLAQTGANVAVGQDVTSFLGSGTQVKVDRPQALLSLLPNGYQLQRLYKTYQQANQQYKPGTAEYQQAQKQWQQTGQQMLPNAIFYLLGLPSVYHMGVERPPVDDSKFENWVSTRDAIHARLTQYSDEVFQGKLSPLEYARHKHEEQIKENQLNADTWGKNSPGASLASSYQQLATQFGLDNSGLSTQDWFERYDAFLPAWNQLLQSASPSTRAAWWEHSTMQWTDADYLEWEAKQLRDSLAASIDHQGGNYIRAVQNQLFRLKPTLTVAEYKQMQQSDPYYLAYTTLLKEMGKTSALGAFVSAFSSPYSQTYVPPAGLTPDQGQQLAQHTGQVVIRPETAQQLATQAKKIAHQSGVAQAGGQPEQSPDFQQQEQATLDAAQSGISQGQ